VFRLRPPHDLAQEMARHLGFRALLFPTVPEDREKVMEPGPKSRRSRVYALEAYGIHGFDTPLR